jgi:metallo-beta-lactamase class B
MAYPVMSFESKAHSGFSRGIRLGAAVLLFLCAAASGHSQSDGGKLLPPPTKKIYTPPYPNNPVKPFQILGNIYYVGMTNYTSFLITTPAGHFLLDTEGEEFVPGIRKNIESLGFQLKDIKFLLTTHAHSDHVGGLAALKGLTGGKVAVMAQDAEALATGREEPGTEDSAEVPVMAQDASVLADGGTSDFRSDGRQLWKPVKADRILNDGDTITLGGMTMVAHLTAGHTKGCTAWSTVAEENGKKYNVVFICSNRLNDNIPIDNNPKYPTMVSDFTKGFETLKKLPCDVFLASHAYMFDMEGKRKQQEAGATPNPFIDPEGYRTYIADYEYDFRYRLQQERLAKAGQAKP